MRSRRRVAGLLLAAVAGIVVGRASLGLDSLGVVILTAVAALALVVTLAPWALRDAAPRAVAGSDSTRGDDLRALVAVADRESLEPDHPVWDREIWLDVPAVAAGVRPIKEAPQGLSYRADGKLQLRVDAKMMLVLAGQRRT